MARELTVKRGLTRMNTIKSQLVRICSEINQYAAWNTKKVHPLGQRGSNAAKSQSEAAEHISSLYQQFDDLTKELIKIKTAIDKSNIETVITVGEEKPVTLTIAESLNYRRYIAEHVRSLVNSYNRSVVNAQNDVERYNQKFTNLDETDAKNVLADVLYLVPLEKIAELDKFLTEFLTELDGTIDESNGVTKIVIEE